MKRNMFEPLGAGLQGSDVELSDMHNIHRLVQCSVVQCSAVQCSAV